MNQIERNKILIDVKSWFKNVIVPNHIANTVNAATWFAQELGLEQTDLEAIAIRSIILEEVKQYFIQQGWEPYTESDIKLIR